MCPFSSMFDGFCGQSAYEEINIYFNNIPERGGRKIGHLPCSPHSWTVSRLSRIARARTQLIFFTISPSYAFITLCQSVLLFPQSIPEDSSGSPSPSTAPSSQTAWSGRTRWRRRRRSRHHRRSAASVGTRWCWLSAFPGVSNEKRPTRLRELALKCGVKS